MPTTTTCPPQGKVAKKGRRGGQQGSQQGSQQGRQEQAGRAQRVARVQTKVSKDAASTQAEEMEFEDESEDDEDDEDGDGDDEDVELDAAKPTQKAKVELTPPKTSKVPKVPEGGEEPISTGADDTENDGEGKSTFSIVGEAWEKKANATHQAAKPEWNSSSRAKQTYHKVNDSMLKEGEAWAAKVTPNSNSNPQP